jgi:hypothetical protein
MRLFDITLELPFRQIGHRRAGRRTSPPFAAPEGGIGFARDFGRRRMHKDKKLLVSSNMGAIVHPFTRSSIHLGTGLVLLTLIRQVRGYVRLLRGDSAFSGLCNRRVSIL